MSSTPWMPFFVGDYLADTARLTTLAHGAYILILMDYWSNGPPPDDDAVLAQIARVKRVIWDRKLSQNLRDFFIKMDDGLLHQKRMDIERSRTNRLDRKTKDNASIVSIDQFDGANSTIPSRVIARQPHPEKKKKGSDPGGSDADASKTQPDVRSELWSSGMVSLRALTGFAEAKARGVMGKLCQAADDDCAVVARAVTAAVDLQPGDPVAWLTQAVAKKRTNGHADAFAWIDRLGEGGSA